MSSQVARDEAGELVTPPCADLVVTWQHAKSRAIYPVGVLSRCGGKYFFRYVEQVQETPNFYPLPGLPDFDAQYEARDLFPVFAQRVMDPRRPDYERYITELGLDHTSATPWEQLIRSSGSRQGDTIQLFPLPDEAADPWALTFLVHGIRHLQSKTVHVHGEERGGYSPDALEGILSDLASGDELEIVRESDNMWAPHALLVATGAHQPLGYIPDWLAERLQPFVDEGQVRVTVDQVNPSSVPWHMRVLAKLEVHYLRESGLPLSRAAILRGSGTR